MLTARTTVIFTELTLRDAARVNKTHVWDKRLEKSGLWNNIQLRLWAREAAVFWCVNTTGLSVYCSAPFLAVSHNKDILRSLKLLNMILITNYIIVNTNCHEAIQTQTLTNANKHCQQSISNTDMHSFNTHTHTHTHTHLQFGFVVLPGLVKGFF